MYEGEQLKDEIIFDLSIENDIICPFYDKSEGLVGFKLRQKVLGIFKHDSFKTHDVWLW